MFRQGPVPAFVHGLLEYVAKGFGGGHLTGITAWLRSIERTRRAWSPHDGPSGGVARTTPLAGISSRRMWAATSC